MAENRPTSNDKWYLKTIKILVIISTLSLICCGLYLCFGTLTLIRSHLIYKRFLSFGIVLISFGVIVLAFSTIPKNFYGIDQQSNVFSCGSLMIYSASLVGIIVAIIIFFTTFDGDLETEAKRTQTIGYYSVEGKLLKQAYAANNPNLNDSQPCVTDLECKEYIKETSALLQMIAIIVSVLNGLFLNLLSLVTEYNKSQLT